VIILIQAGDSCQAAHIANAHRLPMNPMKPGDLYWRWLDAPERLRGCRGDAVLWRFGTWSSLPRQVLEETEIICRRNGIPIFMIDDRMSELPPILTPELASQLLACAPKTVEERLRSGDLPGEKFGDGWILPTRALLERVNEIAVERMLERRKGRGDPPGPTAVSFARARRGPPALV
jgi:hypothetical protein